jgi:hypothetical protein
METGDPRIAETYTFNDLDTYRDIAEHQLPAVESHDVYAHHEDADAWEQWHYRQSLWTDDEAPELVGVVSDNDDFYNVIQYEQVLGAVGDAIEQYMDDGTIDDVRGRVTVADPPYKQSTCINFDGDDTTIYAAEDDPVDLGLRVQSGHSGFHGVHYDVGAERVVCSNGMKGFVADMEFDQTHQDTFSPALAYQAVDTVVKGADTVEDRLQTAQSETLLNQDEALLVLLDAGVADYLDQPVPDLLNALHDEVDDLEEPTLWETYNAATRALTHYSGAPDHVVDAGFDAAATVLETGAGVPDADQLGADTVAARSRELVEDQDAEAEAYWDGERDAVRELLDARDMA